jgi:hypothetical protein
LRKCHPSAVALLQRSCMRFVWKTRGESQEWCVVHFKMLVFLFKHEPVDLDAVTGET